MDDDLSSTSADLYQAQDEVYVFVKFLGHGSFGRVNLYRNATDNSLVVWKEIDLKKLEAKFRNEAFAEVEILSMLDHPNIITYYKYFIGDDTLYIELEYAKIGNLTSQIKLQKQNEQYYDQEIILWYLYQLCSAVEYIHDIGIMHRDIKTLNIFLMQSNLLKLGDFGIAKFLDSSGMLDSQVGTPFYMSPEIIEGKKYSTKSDIWSLGCVAYEMLTLNKVWDATNQLKLAIKISECNINDIELSQYDIELKDLVKKILSKNPSDRPTARDILNHELFSSRAISYNSKIEHLNLNSKRSRIIVSSSSESNLLINSPASSGTNSVNYLSNTFQNQTIQSPIIASKLSEVYIWGGGRNTPKKIEYFNKENTPLHVALGSSHYAVITVEKELYTWGVSSAGGMNSISSIAKLGHGKNFGFTRIPKRVEALNGISIVQVAITNETTCCVSDNGDLYVFGSNYYGCLGIKNSDVEEENVLDETNSLFSPKKLTFFNDNHLKIAKIACGDSHVIVLTDSNQIFTWGLGEYGRLGHGDETDRCEPTEIKFKFNYTFKNVFAGPDCSFILTKEGRVLAFGNNEYNKLCLNSNTIGFKNQNTQKSIQNALCINQQLTPKIIKHLTPYNISKICSGENHTVLLDCFGRLYSFGSNKFGQLGIGDFRVHNGLNLVGGPLVGKNVTNVACGDSFTICSTSENLVFTWGCSKNGRLGIEPSLGNDGNVCLPRPIFGSLHLVSEMSARHWNSIIIAEQILDTKPVKTQSYADYIKKTSNYDLANESSDLVKPVEFDIPNNLINNSENIEAQKNLTFLNDHDNQNNLIFQEKIISRDNSETDVPEWLKKDLEDADFIPFEAYEKNEPVVDIKKKTDSIAGLKSKNIQNLEEALIIISRLELENSKLKEENRKLHEKLSEFDEKYKAELF